MKKAAVSLFMLVCLFSGAGLSFAQEEGADSRDSSAQQVDAVKEASPVQQEAIRPQEGESRQEKAAKGEPSGSKADAEKTELLDRIEELEKRINELSQESRARRKLEITEQEKQEKEKEVLEAVGREYTLDPKHSLGVDYSVVYSYSPSETITKVDDLLEVKDEAEHTVRHIISVSYGILNNLGVSSSVPFLYRYNEMGTDEELQETDIGDISVGVSYQPWKAKAGEVNKTFSLSASLPTGRSPYKINPDTELSTGNGVYSLSAGASFSKELEPVVAFWSVSYSHAFPAQDLDHKVQEAYILDKVEPGDSMSVSMGLAYALSYKVSVNSSFSYSYSRSSSYYYRGATTVLKSGDDSEGSLGFGIGWKASTKTTLSFGLSYSLTSSGFSVSCRVPFNFVL